MQGRYTKLQYFAKSESAGQGNVSVTAQVCAVQKDSFFH